MKLALNLSLFLFILFTFGDKTFSLTDYQIKRICENERRKFTCIKTLQEKRNKLQKGNYIEIPVVPSRR